MHIFNNYYSVNRIIIILSINIMDNNSPSAQTISGNTSELLIVFILFVLVFFLIPIVGIWLYYEHSKKSHINSPEEEFESGLSTLLNHDDYQIYDHTNFVDGSSGDYITHRNYGVNFRNHSPADRMQDIVDEFGTPNIFFNEPGGFAIWQKPDYFEKIMLKDESIAHSKPKPHCDFLYTTINVYIPEEKICQVMMISESIMYDRLKRELTTRCHFMGANIATLFLAMQFANDELTFDEVMKLFGTTISKITRSEKFYSDTYVALRDLVRANRRKYIDVVYPNKNCREK
jgi:hypothetical protein